jgi:putative hydroxymethylpyrimidine transport system ATP-binding protein
MNQPASDRNHAPKGLALSLEDAGLSFAGRPVFEGLSLELPAGAVTCLLGPSGVGKSSLLRLIAGLTPEATARRLAAQDGETLAGRIAYMDQRDLLLPWLSVVGNVALGSRLRGEPARHEVARALLDRVGLGDRAGDRPATLSGGMRQRAALARTLMEDRPLVLMDEPFSALDALTRLRLQDLAAELLVGRTVLLVTHDPMEALRIGHRIHVLAGDPAVLDEPLEPPGAPPRDATDPALHRLYAQLLRRLGAEGGAGS